MKQPKKVISLVPSLTELLIDLGLRENLVGRTRFCIHPEEAVRDIPIIGGTKNPNLDKIRESNPEIIIANKEENRKEDIDELSSGFRIYLTDISSVEEALITIIEIGEIFDVKNKAKKLVDSILAQLELSPDEPVKSVAYFIWRNPWMVAGGDTYINSVLSHYKLRNIYSDKLRYPKVNHSESAKRNPDYIFLSSEPYPFKEKHIEEVEKKCNKSKVILTNGEWFSWYGSRMLPSFKELNLFRKAIG